MREILFKAKTISGNWVKGLLANENDKWYISNKVSRPFAYEIRPETICQYTGLTDKNGEEIWENDIVMHEDQYAPVKFGLYMQSPYYYKNIYGFYVDFPEDTLLRKDFGFWHKKVEVVGNIFDNLELLREVPE